RPRCCPRSGRQARFDGQQVPGQSDSEYQSCQRKSPASGLPPGTFLMGSPESEPGRRDDEVQHRVTLTKGFYLGIHPVTQAQWLAVTGNDPSYSKGDNLPVENVSWNDCQEFCRKLGEKLGKCFRLPTEAEWEYACRAGKSKPWPAPCRPPT